jgi:hypothetical protein
MWRLCSQRVGVGRARRVRWPQRRLRRATKLPTRREQGQCFIQVEAAVVDRMRPMRRPGKSYSEVILKLVELRPKISCASGPAAQFRELEMGPAQTG